MSLPERFAHLAWIERLDGGAAWLHALSRLLDECIARWSLQEVGEVYTGSQVSLVMPVTLTDGVDAVLKVQFPHRESEHEAAALETWDGDGAIRLLEHDPPRASSAGAGVPPPHASLSLGERLALRASGAAIASLQKSSSAPRRPPSRLGARPGGRTSSPGP